MELLYVWIHDYKNIHQQGFNFSSEYHIDYDPDTEQLTIEDNPDYIEDFWGERITNMTAIVGENGAGKSTLIDFIFKLQKPYFCQKQQLIIVLPNEVYCSEGINIKIKYETKKWGQPKKISKEGSNPIPSLFKLPIFRYSNTYSYGIPDFNQLDLSTTQAMYQSKQWSDQAYAVQYLSQLTTYEQEEYKKQISFVSELLLNKTYNKGLSILFNEPNQIRINLINDNINFIEKDSPKLIGKLHKFDEAKQYDSEKSTTFLERFYFRFVLGLIIISTNANGFSADSAGLESEIRIINNLFTSPEYFIDKEFIRLYLEHLEELSLTKNIDLAFPYTTEIFESISEFIGSPKFEAYLENNYNLSARIPLLNHKKTIFDLVNIGFATPILKFAWANKNELIHLSSGEQAMLSLMSRVYSAWNLRIQKHDGKDYQTIHIKNTSNIVLLIDEGELGLHPQWQKQYVGNLSKFLNILCNDIKTTFLNSTKQNIQIILTSHSPLILSDFPSDNVIFLEKDKETGFCKVVSGTQKQTFGANIHALLADSFFLQDGTIGTFAMRKIEELIDEIKAIQELTTQKELKEIEAKIELIGEPLLKRKIHTYFKKQSEIPQQRISLDQQIALTQERLKKLQEERAKHPNLKNRNQDKGRGNDQSQNL